MRTASQFAWTFFILGFCAPFAYSQEKIDVKPPFRFRFTEVTTEVGLAKYLRGAFAHGTAWGDFDNDGRLDIFFGTFSDRSPRYGMKRAPTSMLFRQLPGGKFERFRSPAVEIPSRCSGAVFVDLDNDGDLDLYVSSNTMVKPSMKEPRRTAQAQLCKLYRNDGGGRFVDISKECGACPPSLLRCRDIGVFDYDCDGLLDLFVMQDKGIRPEDKIIPLQLFRNLGNLRFENVAPKIGLSDPLWSTGIAVGDLNGDGRPDFHLAGCNRLFLSQPNNTYCEVKKLRPVLIAPEKELDWVTGTYLGDLDRDGDLDLVTGRHNYFGPSRVHVYLNDGLKKGVPQLREITKELGISPLPQKAPHPEIQDFDNDGLVDLYWSAWFAEGDKRWPFICRGQGVKNGMPRFAVPPTNKVKAIYDKRGRVQNTVPTDGLGMVYYVNGSAVDYDSDGDLDFLVGNWPDEPCRFFRNDGPSGNWLQVRVEGKRMNRMGIGAKVSVYRAGRAGEKTALLGFQEITVNGGYSSSRPAVAHFGLGKLTQCDVIVDFPRPANVGSYVARKSGVNRILNVREP